MNKIKTVFAWIWHKLCAFWPWYKSLYQGRAWYTKTIVAFVSCIVAFIIYLGAVDINFLWLFGKSPALLQAHRYRPYRCIRCCQRRPPAS